MDDGFQRLRPSQARYGTNIPLTSCLSEYIIKTKENVVRFMIRTIAAGAVSIAARIIIKKIQDKKQGDAAA